ncbi:hypothetical protein U1Q18_049901 [Sarracenia purpurea var. burkii]
MVRVVALGSLMCGHGVGWTSRPFICEALLDCWRGVRYLGALGGVCGCLSVGVRGWEVFEVHMVPFGGLAVVVRVFGSCAWFLGHRCIWGEQLHLKVCYVGVEVIGLGCYFLYRPFICVIWLLGLDAATLPKHCWVVCRVCEGGCVGVGVRGWEAFGMMLLLGLWFFVSVAGFLG